MCGGNNFPAVVEAAEAAACPGGAAVTHPRQDGEQLRGHGQCPLRPRPACAALK